MEKVSRVLICIDFSDYSNVTLEYGRQIAASFQAETFILNVINQRDVDAVTIASRTYSDMINPQAFLGLTRKDRTERLEELIGTTWTAEEQQPRIIIQVGVPVEKILQTIDDEKIDLIVLGNKGRGNFALTLLGSTAEKIFRHAPIPVLSVKKRQQ